MTDTRPDVLVVDDQESIRVLTSRWLEGGGYRVLSVGSAAEALAVMEEQEVRVVVTDVHLDGRDGLWLARQIREDFPDSAVVFISGDPGAALTLARAGIGAFDYLQKPFTTAQLLEAVDRGTCWHEERVVERRQRVVAGAELQKPVWSYDKADQTWVQQADWLPSPAAVGRLVADMHLHR